MKRNLLRLGLGTLGLLLLIAGGYLAPILYPGKSVTLTERADLLSPDFEISTPAGEGPFPVALLFHGCGGLIGQTREKEIMRGYADAANDAGFAAIIVDSFSPRDIGFDEAVTTVCTGLKLRGRVRAGDVLAAIAHAKTLPFVDQDNIILAGWSHGGWTIMDLMTMDLADDWPAALKRPPANILEGVTGLYLTYPFCGFPALSTRKDWAHTLPTSVVIAERDRVAQLGNCAKALIKMDADGVPLEVEIFENVTHAFDEEDQTETSLSVFAPAATERAHERFTSFLMDIENNAAFPNESRVRVELDR